MLLILLQGRTPDTAVRYAGTGAAVATATAQALGGARRFHPVAVYELTVDDKQAEYIHLDRRGT